MFVLKGCINSLELLSSNLSAPVPTALSTKPSIFLMLSEDFKRKETPALGSARTLTSCCSFLKKLTLVKVFKLLLT